MPPSSKLAATFAARLRAARELRELSQEDLAARAGLQPSAVSHFETGTRKPSFENLRRLADALEVNTDYLLGRVDQVDAVAPQGELFRQLGQLSATDRDNIKMFVDSLAKKKRGKQES